MKLGICSHPSALGAFPELPFDFIEGNVQSVLLPEKPAEDFAAEIAAARTSLSPMISANCFLPGDLKVAGPTVDSARLERYADTAFARARAIGMTTIVFGSGQARRVPDGWSQTDAFEQFVAALRLCGPLAEKHGVTLVVEPLNRGDCNLINTIDEGAEAVRRAGQPRVRLLADFFHMLRNDEAPDAIERHAGLIVHAHLAEKEGRTQPGAVGDDFRPFLRALRKATKCRTLALECSWTTDVTVAAGPALAALRRQMMDAGYGG